jgi:2-dehydro-3-deoxyphosphogluconate aldolase/(4S)-4-hydroxy-2-oxoglutarate aldolase
MQIDRLLSISPVIPVVTLHDPAQAVPLARALLEGEVGIVEITLRTPAALASIERIVTHVPAMTVVAGTVCTAEQVRDCVHAGAAAVVSPGITERLAKSVAEHHVTWLPGVANASDIMRGMEFGLSRFKLFPASVVGGPEALRAFAGPFPGVQFCPTGGIDRTSSARYLELGNVACIGGSWVAPDGLVRAGDWGTIRDNAQYCASLQATPGLSRPA